MASSSSAVDFSSSSADENESCDSLTSSESSTFEITPCDTDNPSAVAGPLKGELVGQSKSCCCVSAEEMTADWMNWLFVGWRSKSVGSSDSGSTSHCISLQVSDKSLSSLVNTGSSLLDGSNQMNRASSNTGSGSKIPRQPLLRGIISLFSDSKSSLRGYIHSIPTIPYTFQHHVSEDCASLYMEEYRRSYTYPSLEEKCKKMPENLANVPTTVKPTLFVLDNITQHSKKGQESTRSRTKLDSYGGYDSLHKHNRRSSPVPSSSKTPGYKRYRELGVPRNSSKSKAQQTEALTVSGESPSMQQFNNDEVVKEKSQGRINGSEDCVFSSGTGTDKAPTCFSRNASPSPFTWDAAEPYAKPRSAKKLSPYATEGRLPLKQSLFASPLPMKARIPQNTSNNAMKKESGQTKYFRWSSSMLSSHDSGSSLQKSSCKHGSYK